MSLKRESHTQTFIRGSAVSLLGFFVLGVINYLVRRYLSLNLSTTDFGFMYSAYSLCMLLLAYLDLGLGQSTTILLSKSMTENKTQEAKSIFSFFLSIRFISSFIVFLIMLATYRFWVHDFFKYDKLIPYFAIMTLLISGSLLSAMFSILTSVKRFITLTAFQISAPLLIFIYLYSVNINKEVIIPAILFPFAYFLIFFLIFFLLIKLDIVFSFRSLKNTPALHSIFHLSKWLAISFAGLSTVNYLDSISLTYFRTLEEVALYNIALPIMQIAQCLSVFPAVFIPIVSEMWHRNNTHEISRICKLVTEILLYILWPVSFTIILTSKYIIIILFSEKFVAASAPLIILFIGNIFFTIASFYMATLNSGTYAAKVAYSIIVCTGLNILLNFILVPFFGMVGAASATALSYIAISFILYHSLRKSLESFKFVISENLYIIIVGTLGIMTSLFFKDCNIFYTIILTLLLNALFVIITMRKLNYFAASVIFLFKNNNPYQG